MKSTSIYQRLKFLCFALMLLALFESRGQSFNSWTDLKSRKVNVLKVAFFESPGIIFHNNQQVSGLGVDIMQDFVKYLNTRYGLRLRLEFVQHQGNFAQFLQLIQSNPNVLAIGAITITEERQKFLYFSKPFLTSPNIVICHKNNPNLIKSEFIHASTPVMLEGSSQKELLKKFLEGRAMPQKLEYLNSPEAIIDKICNYPSYYTILGLNDFLEPYRKGLPVKFMNFDLGKYESFGIAMALQSDWKSVIDEFLTTTYLNSPAYKLKVANQMGSIYMNRIK